jgi:N6-adenosine-specific RNA methylase IME4
MAALNFPGGQVVNPEAPLGLAPCCKETRHPKFDEDKARAKRKRPEPETAAIFVLCQSHLQRALEAACPCLKMLSTPNCRDDHEIALDYVEFSRRLAAHDPEPRLPIELSECSVDEDFFHRLVRVGATSSTSLLGVEHRFPASSSFVLSDAALFNKIALQSLAEDTGTEASATRLFDVVLLDPPWGNKSVQRGHMYSTLSSAAVAALDVGRLCAPSAIVAVWVTNNERLIADVRVCASEMVSVSVCVCVWVWVCVCVCVVWVGVMLLQVLQGTLACDRCIASLAFNPPPLTCARKEILFRRWGVKPVAEWLWAKANTDGTLVSDLHSTHHRPYEILMIGTRGEPAAPVPRWHTIISVPSAHHSRKPSVHRLLEAARRGTLDESHAPSCSGSLQAGPEHRETGKAAAVQGDRASTSHPPSPLPTTTSCAAGAATLVATAVHLPLKCMELFARHVQPGWLAWGNEAVKFQNITYHHQPDK